MKLWKKPEAMPIVYSRQIAIDFGMKILKLSVIDRFDVSGLERPQHNYCCFVGR